MKVVIIGFLFILHVHQCSVAETLSMTQKRERVSKEWPNSLSASSSPEGVSSDAQNQEEYEYVYVDENGDYYASSDEDGEDEEEEDDDDEEEDSIQSTSPSVIKSGYTIPPPPQRPPSPPRPYTRVNTLTDIQEVSSCLPRNHTYMEKLRDDHQLNLKQEKSQMKERRREKRERKAQEIADLEEEHDDRRFQMSRMNTHELLEQEAQAERFEKAKLQKQADEAELAKSNSKTLSVGDKVMARYQRKAKYLFGKISNVRVDGSYDIKYDNGKDEMRVDKSLIIKPESEREITRGTKIGVNEEQKAQAVTMKEQQKQDLLEMQARQEQLVAEELAAQEERNKDPGRLVGSDCESQACGACKLVVEEFAQRVHKNINNKEVQTIAALFDYMTPFCASPQIANKYTKVVEIVCKKMFTMRDHREFFVREFEADSDWANVLSASTLLPKKQKICQTSGFCQEDSFVYERDDKDDGWGSDECFMCHAVMEDLEEKVSLYRKVDDRIAGDLAKTSCGNLVLPPSLAKTCNMLTKNTLQVEVAWKLKLHFEAIRKGKLTHRGFPDQACEQLSQCRRWVDPDTDVREQVRNEVVQVFA